MLYCRDVPRQDMVVRGRVYTATPLVRDNMCEGEFALLSELGRRSLYSKSVLAALLFLLLPKSPLDPDVSFADGLEWYLACS